jgi:hypothetical protein
MSAQVDVLVRLANAGECGVDNDVYGGDEGDDAAIVAGVGAGVEDVCFRDVRNGIPNGVYNFGATAFRKIGYALDQFHCRRFEMR